MIKQFSPREKQEIMPRCTTCTVIVNCESGDIICTDDDRKRANTNPMNNPATIHKNFSDPSYMQCYINVCKKLLVTDANFSFQMTASCSGVCIRDNEESEMRAGVGVAWYPPRRQNISKRLPGIQAVDRSGLYSIIVALECSVTLIQNKWTGTWSSLLITTDSIYVLRCIINIMSDPTIGIRNHGMVRYIISLIKRCDKYGCSVKFKYVEKSVNSRSYILANGGRNHKELQELDWSFLRRVADSH